MCAYIRSKFSFNIILITMTLSMTEAGPRIVLLHKILVGIFFLSKLFQNDIEWNYHYSSGVYKHNRVENEQNDFNFTAWVLYNYRLSFTLQWNFSFLHINYIYIYYNNNSIYVQLIFLLWIYYLNPMVLLVYNNTKLWNDSLIYIRFITPTFPFLLW